MHWTETTSKIIGLFNKLKDLMVCKYLILLLLLIWFIYLNNVTRIVFFYVAISFCVDILNNLQEL